MKKIIIELIVFIVMLQGAAFAEDSALIPQIAIYLDSAEIQAEAKNLWSVARWNADTDLVNPIFHVAVSQEGKVAILSGPSHQEYSDVISVYEDDGEFMYGYQVGMAKNEKGRGSYFFTDDDVLCYVTQFPDYIVVYALGGDGQGIIESYHISSFGVLAPLGVWKNETVTIHPGSPYRIAAIDEAKLSIVNENTNVVTTPYDHQEEFERNERIGWIKFGAGCVVMFFFIGLICKICLRMELNRHE